VWFFFGVEKKTNLRWMKKKIDIGVAEK